MLQLTTKMAPNFHPSTFKNLKPLHNLFFFIFIFISFVFVYENVYFNTSRPQHIIVNTTLPKTPTDLRQSIRSQTHFSTTLATHLLSNKFPDSNVVFSPLSIHVVLCLPAAGSKGSTHDQLLAYLKTNTTDDRNSLYSQLVPFIFADGSPSDGPRLSFVNAILVANSLSFKPSFKQVVDTVYKATCKQVDFENKAVEIANEVNLWAKKQTNGFIKQIIPANAVNKFTSLIFANAVYFKGQWSQGFIHAKTEESDFHLLNGSKVRVPFMTNDKEQFVSVYEDFKVLGLPYLQGQDNRQFAMYIFLPNAKDGLQSLVGKLGSSSDFLERHIPRRKVEVRKFFIPKFKFSFGFEASNMLNELGVVSPSDDFTEIVDGNGLYVSDIHHKSFVEVNEEGTIATAVTILSMTNSHSMLDFVADHPFLFVIREDVTGALLFMGQVINPHVD